MEGKNRALEGKERKNETLFCINNTLFGIQDQKFCKERFTHSFDTFPTAVQTSNTQLTRPILPCGGAKPIMSNNYSDFPFNASTTNVALLISYVESSVGGPRVTSPHQHHLVSPMQIKHAQSKGKRCVCHVPMYYATAKLHYMTAQTPLLMLSVHT